MDVPYFDLRAQYDEMREEILAALDSVCRRAAFCLGEEVASFESDFASYCNAKHCVALNSGTSALHLALLAIGVGSGDEVITSPNTFIATAEAISYTGAKPVFVDIDPATANIDPAKVREAINPQTKAILPVHLYGRPADMAPLGEIARTQTLPIIEDACQAHGARYHGQRVGTLGRAAAFSFYPPKNLGAYGEGGALVTNADGIAEFARAMRDHGQHRRYFHDRVGYNYRMDGFQGAVLRIKLRRLERWTARRRELAALYCKLLSGARLEMLRDDPGNETVYHLMVVCVEDRDEVRRQLELRGVHTAVHYPVALHLQKAYAGLGYSSGSFPVAERACARVMSLPFFPEMTNEQVEYVASVMREVVGTK